MLAACTGASHRAADGATATPRAPADGAPSAGVVNGAAALPQPTPSATSLPPSEDVPRPVERPPARVSLDVEGFEAATVSFPPTATYPQPLLVATHGAGDTPDQMCELWRAILGDHGVILCPAGPRMYPHEEGRYYPDHHALERIVFASLASLVDRFAPYVEAARAVYTGYSQGATMGALMIPSHGGQCPRLVLAEGGFDDWSLERASTFKRAGGERVLFVCGRQRCKDAAERSAAWFRSAGVDVKVVAHVGEGHVIRVAQVAGPSLEWLLGDDARWGLTRPAAH